jgi:exopolysaccharide production protein ExoQ
MPQLATLLCIIFIVYIFWLDIRENPDVSNALWIPLIWMFIAASRFVSFWLDPGAQINVMDLYQEGSPVDRAVFIALIIAGVMVLYRRGLDWAVLLANNKLICLFFLYCAVSVVWSDDPFISLKRWIKFLGTPVMVLVVLTEERPYYAMGTLLRRLAFLTIPVSILFIKYYPDLGRTYHMGRPLFNGIATHKNLLGSICLITGMYFSWSLIFRWREEIEKGRNSQVIVALLFLIMIAWLLYMADSATSLICWLAALCFFAAGKVPAVSSEPRKFVLYGVSMIVLIGVLQNALNIREEIISGLGRRTDLTMRVPIWEMLLKFDTNPVLGAGFESFWSSERLDIIWKQFPGIVQAHNGFLELYLNIGMIGLILFLITITNGLMNTIKQLEYDYSISVMRIAFIIIVALSNWTEATIRPLSNMFAVLLFGLLDISSWTEQWEDDAPSGAHDCGPE